MGTLRFTLLLLLSIIASFSAVTFGQAMPDFAYPQNVTKEAEKELNVALNTDDGNAIVSSLVKISLAQNAISTDNLPNIITRIETIRNAEKDRCTQALLNLLLIDIYTSIYSQDRWKYDSRELPLEPLATDYNEWSAEQFKHKILLLCDSALIDAATIKATSLKNYESLLTTDRETFIFYPTLYDFIARHIIERLKDIQSDVALPDMWLVSHDAFTQLDFQYTTSIVQHILNIYKDLLEFHASQDAPFIDCDIDRITYLNTYTSKSGALNNERCIDILKALYDEKNGSEYAAETLIAIYNLTQQDWLYEEIEHRLKTYPAYFNNCRLENIISLMSKQDVQLSAQGTVIPNDTMQVKAHNRNTTDYTINIYRIPFTEEDYYKSQNYCYSKTNPPTLLQSIPITCHSQKILFTNDTVIDIAFDTPGIYSIVPMIEGNEPFHDGEYINTIHCTTQNIILSGYDNDIKTWVVNPLTGAPVEDAQITTINNRIFSKVGDDFYAYPQSQSRVWSYGNHSVRCTANIYTDLSIYHPGDTINWCAIIYAHTDSINENKIVADTEIKATLIDANNQIIDSLTCATDAFGRIDGAFIIPSEGLTGLYTIRLNQEKYSGSTQMYQQIMVSDYKLPTFFVEIPEIIEGEPTNGAVTLHGKVETYSGFALANIEITANISVMRRLYWRWNRNSNTPFYSLTTKTDENGTFTIELPAELFDNAPIRNGIFSCQVTAISSTNESQETVITFTPGTAYIITAALKNAIDVQRPTKLDVKVTNSANKPIDTMVNYQVEKGDTIIKSGDFPTNSPIVDWTDVPSGKYRIVFFLNDKELAETEYAENVVLYRPTDKLPPINSPIWVPQEEYIIESGNKVDIMYGVTNPDSHILYTLWDGKQIYEQQWIVSSPGIKSLAVTLPDSIDAATVTLQATSNYQSECHNIKVKTRNPIKGIILTAESFRDKITPGDNERWTFRVNDVSGKGIASAMIFDMYAKSLDNLRTSQWGFATLNTPKSYQTNSSYPLFKKETSSTLKLNECTSWTRPTINTYGQSYSQPTINILLTRNVSQLNATATLDQAEGNGELSDADTSTETTDEDENANFSYRPTEMPLAFFQPMLTTDEDGQLTFSFTVPNANTTWRFNAIAYTAELLSSVFASDVMANKPVMVQSNMPRYLRSGDNAIIKASIMNNSDSASVISTVVEIYDPANGEIIKRQEQSDHIDSGKSTVVAIEINAPSDITMLGYRIKSSSAAFADGEQTIIPVLPSSTPVIEAHPFYLTADSTTYAVTLPEMPLDTRVTLQFCENPTWYVVTALPGLRADDANTSLSAATAIFSAAIAEGIIKDNPSIRLALTQWQESDKNDSTLMSMLERNSDLKTMLLNATPWMMDARSDTERMARLALLFDKKEIATTYSHNISLLAKLQCQDGGWSWISGTATSSKWCTLKILGMMGRLNQLGYLPEDKQLWEIITKAISYIDNETASQYAKSPKGNYTDYVVVRDYFPEIGQPTAAREATNATVQRLISDWKKQDVANKAVAAVILNNHQYKTTAKEILRSLREYSQSTPSHGRWWPSMDNCPTGKIGATATALDAFNAIEPNCNEIDQIRQWLILQKEANDWGTSVTTSNVIASILNTGTQWTRNAQGCVITLGGNEITPNNIEKVTGYFRSDISSMNPSKARLTIDKAGSYPSWGAIYCQYHENMGVVEPASSEAISIAKQIYRQVPTAEGEKWVVADSLTTGDRVKVELIIKATRDIDYATIIDERAACFEPVEQLPAPIFTEGIYFYRENRDAATNIFVTHLPKGTYMLSYELFVNNAGEYSSGIASIQSQYAPQITAHSAGNIITIKNQ